MSTTRKTHFDITLYGIEAGRRNYKPISTLWRNAKRNRTLCERHGHDWRRIRRACMDRLRSVEVSRRRLAL